MTRAAVTIDDHLVKQALNELLTLTGNIAPVLDEIGDIVQQDILLNFKDQHDPDGEPWLELSDVTLANRRKKGKGAEILRDTGALNKSITHNVLGNSVEIGSDKVYANMMHYGGKKADFPWLYGDIPERPFVGVSAEKLAEILTLLERKIQDATR